MIYGSVGQIKHFLRFSFISGTFGNKRKASRTASSKEHECVTDILFQTNMPEQRVINQPIGTQGSYSERGKSQNNGLATAPFFSPPLVSRFAQNTAFASLGYYGAVIRVTTLGAAIMITVVLGPEIYMLESLNG